MTKKVCLAALGLLIAAGCSGGSAAQGGDPAKTAAAPAPATSGSAGAPAASGGAGPTREQMQAVLKEHERDKKRCYEREQLRGQAFKGDTNLRLKVAPSGSVTSIEPVAVEPAGDFLASCMMETVKTWTFPASAGGSTITLPLHW